MLKGGALRVGFKGCFRGLGCWIIQPLPGPPKYADVSGLDNFHFLILYIPTFQVLAHRGL